ncbi:MAG: hypothetical protein WC748_02555 [Legionellales bacterium]|jgi:hypothetical protein
MELIPLKIKDHNRDYQEFLTLMNERNNFLKTDPKMMHEFRQEMTRFIYNAPYKAGIADDMFWKSLVVIVNGYCEKNSA